MATPATPVGNQLAAQINLQLFAARTLRDGSHRAVIRLSPEHLGDVTVTLDVHGGNVRMDLVAGPQAIGALQADLSDLRNQMAQSGLQLTDVSMRQSGMPTDPGSGGNQPSGNGQSDSSGSPTPGNRSGAGGSSTTAQPVGYRQRGGSEAGTLDVLI